jgi:endoglucanase Acf2
MRLLLKTLSFSVVGVILFLAVSLFIRNVHFPLQIPSFLHKSSLHNLTPLQSNQWYSSLHAGFPSQPLFAFPLAYRLTERGLGFSYPQVISQPNSVFASYVEDFSVGFDQPFTNHSLSEVSDWTITANLQTSSKDNLRFTLGHGLPFTTITSSGKPISLSSLVPFQTQQTKTPNAILLSLRNHTYLIVFPKESKLSKEKNKIQSDSKKVFIALLPDTSKLQAFLDIADIQIRATTANFTIVNQTLLTTYTLETNGKTSLIALFPHQADFLVTPLQVLGTYKTLRGNMHLVQANSFTTKLTLQTPPADFAPLKTPDAAFVEQVKTDIAQTLSQPPSTSQNYYLGTYFGKVATLIQLADVANLPKEKQILISFLKPTFLQSMDYYAYDKTKFSLIAKNSEFGNDNLNDHHFHYGYYLRTAAILGKDDKEFVKQITPTMNEMAHDIATTDRNNAKYPFLRNFDIYEGHSWAAGFANFADGNNQESTSEALNAWYGLSLWAKITNNLSLHDYALYLFTTELTSTRYYWFNEKNIYPAPYQHALASIVWGGKVDFTTWFSDQSNMIYGIQLLPFTPASTYLKQMKPFDRYEKDFLASGGNYATDWGELMLMWKSLATTNQQTIPQTRISAMYDRNPPSLYLYHTLLRKQ